MNYQTETIYAGFWRRLVAFCIDSALLLLLLIPLRFLLAFLGAFGLMNQPVFFEFTTAQLWVFLLQLLYFAAFTGAFGATPGKMILHMKVVSTRTGTLLWRDAIYRETIGRVMNLLLLIGYIIVPFDHQKRTLADRFCDTRVLATRKYKPAIGRPPQNISYAGPTPPAPAFVPQMPAEPQGDTPIYDEAGSFAPDFSAATGFAGTGAAQPAAAAAEAAPAHSETAGPATAAGSEPAPFWVTPSVGATPGIDPVPPQQDPFAGNEPPAGGPISY